MKMIKNFLKLKKINDFEIHVNEFRRRRTKGEVVSNTFDLADLADFCLR